MQHFRYTAVDAAGKTVSGTLESESKAAAVARLHAEGHVVLRAEPAGRHSALRTLLERELFARRGLSKREVADFTRELAIMLGAGQDLDKALRFVVETTTGARARGVFADIRDKVRGGATLATALAAHAGSFTELYRGMVRAGEAGGALAPTLERLASLLERERRIVTSLQSALIYPALLVTAALAVILLLLVYVLPQFTAIFEQAGAELPAATRALIAGGDFVRDEGLWLLLGLLAALLAARQALAAPGVRLAVDRALLSLPVVGGLLRQTAAAYLTRTLGTLLVNGVPLLQALAVVRDVLGNSAARAALVRAEASVKEGAGLARPLEASGVFPVRMVHLLRLGEETGRLAEMALRAADIHDEEVRLGLERLTSLIVPAVTIVTGLAVAGIIASLVTAMLSLNDLAL
ncbi:MAG: type II secretion system F family protein [Alphaproteobacteria bacterium]